MHFRPPADVLDRCELRVRIIREIWQLCSWGSTVHDPILQKAFSRTTVIF
jgi:hypothetical protein